MQYPTGKMAVITCLAALLLLSSAAVSLAKQPRCDLCGKAISGPFFTYTDKHRGRTFTICARCERRSPRCGICTLPLKTPKGWDSKTTLYCPKCLKDLQRCEICGRPQKRGLKFYKNQRTKKFFCEKCYKTAPRCASCNGPVKNGLDVHGKKVCASCQKRVPKCGCCGLPIPGRGISYKYTDGIFCEHCVTTRPHCVICSSPLEEKHTTLTDGRVMCNECRKTAVLSRALLRIIHGRVTNYLRQKLDMNVQFEYELKLVRSRKDLGGLDGEIEGKEQGLFIRVDGVSKILILDGATENMCYETLAHEYAHAWHAERGMQFADKETREGFAQWVASKALEHFGLKDSLRRLRARTDPAYGTGYQKFWAIEKASGTDGVFAYLIIASRKK